MTSQKIKGILSLPGAGLKARQFPTNSVGQVYIPADDELIMQRLGG
jgi:hypothetical protein